MKRITVLLAEDHLIVREGLKKLLEGERDIEVIGEAATGRQAVAMTRKLRPAVVVMDIAMPLLNGLEATRQIRKEFPDTKVLIPSISDAFLAIHKAFARGVEICHRLDAPHRRPAAARITYALDRRGSWASTITTLEGTTRAAGDGDGSPSGHLADCCHRVLGLPAAPEESSPRVLADVLWLIDVLDARAELGESFPIEDWEAIAALHVSTSCDTGELTWSDLHDEIVQRREGWDRFDETEVAWMDPSTFARFALGAHPPIGALLTRLEQLAPRSVMRKVHLLVTSVHQHAGIVRGDPPGGV